MKKAYSMVAAFAAAALALGACGSGGKQELKAGSKDSISYSPGKQEWGGYNGSTVEAYSTTTAAVTDRVQTGFGYYDPQGVWKHGTDLGDYKKLSDDPLTVEYTVNEKAVYQGKTPITCEDFYLDWVSQNPDWILEGQKAAGAVDEKSGEAQPLFNHVSSPEGYAHPVSQGPQCNEGEKKFTVKYDTVYPDWELNVGGPLPSHVVAKKIGMSKQDLFKALKNKDFAVAKKAAEAWNKWNDTAPGKLPPAEEIPSFGPFALKQGGWKAKQYVTLERNPDWWGEKAGTKEFVIKQVEDDAQLQALANGDLNVIEPQATQDSIDRIKKTPNVTLLQGPTMVWEHLDYNFGSNSVFAENKGGIHLRKAMAYCVPRSEIVQKLIKPLDAKAQVLNAREYFPTDKDYEGVVKASYNGEYDKVNIEKAKEHVAASGIKNPTVRIGYRNGNPRRAETVALITASCKKAGITIKDNSSAKFMDEGGEYYTGQWDMALFGWNGSGQVVSGQNIYQTGGQQNKSEYSNKTVDAEWKKIAGTLDKSVWLESKKVIEKQLWDDLFGLPLYVQPGIVGYSNGLENVKRNITQKQVLWNAEKWKWKSTK